MKKFLKSYSLNAREPLEIDTTPYISKNLLQQYICFGVSQACSKVWVAWVWSPTDRNLSNLCLGTTSLLVPETLKFFKNGFQLPTIMGVQSNISLSSCLYWYATLNSCKCLKSETHLWNAQVNKASPLIKVLSKPA